MLYRQILIALIALQFTSQYGEGAIITQWNFNSIPADGSSSTGSLIPSLGVGSTVLVGGVSGTFADGNSENRSSDPAGVDDTGRQLSSFPSQSAASRTAGLEFRVGTTGYEGVVLTWDQRNSNTASRYWAIDYTLNGTTWQQFSGSYEINSGSNWFNGLTADFTSISGANNNSDFGIRLLSIFDPLDSRYVASNSLIPYGTSGTARFDRVTFNGTEITAVPEPRSFFAAAFAMFMVAVRMRRPLLSMPG